MTESTSSDDFDVEAAEAAAMSSLQDLINDQPEIAGQMAGAFGTLILILDATLGAAEKSPDDPLVKAITEIALTSGFMDVKPSPENNDQVVMVGVCDQAAAAWNDIQEALGLIPDDEVMQ